MDNETQLGSDEFSVLIELIITIFFMTIGALYTGVMVTRMNTFAELTYDKDKIDITNAEHIAHDPYYMTGYGAIMLGWVYDNQSEVPVSWLGRSVMAMVQTQATRMFPICKYLIVSML